MHVFDIQTDGQTDTFLIACPRWHSMSRGKSDRDQYVSSNTTAQYYHFISLQQVLLLGSVLY